MITVSEVAEELISKQPFLEEAISKGIINYSALARLIKPQIEEKLLKKIETGAVLMALKRMSLNIKSDNGLKTIISKTPEMIVRSDLVEYTFQSSSVILKKISQLLEHIADDRRYFITFTQGVFETAIIVSVFWQKKIETMLADEKKLSVMDKLSSITIKLPDENIQVPGVYYFILKALAWNGINIIDVVSTNNEFSIILDDREVDRAFTVLKQAFSRN